MFPLCFILVVVRKEQIIFLYPDKYLLYSFLWLMVTDAVIAETVYKNHNA